MEHFGFIAVPSRGGAVGVEDNGPAHPVNHHLMVIPAEQDAVLDAGLAAVGLVGQMVDFTGRRGLVAAAQLVFAHWLSIHTSAQCGSLLPPRCEGVVSPQTNMGCRPAPSSGVAACRSLGSACRSEVADDRNVGSGSGVNGAFYQ